MSKDRLDIIESRGLFSIGWFNEAEGLEGDFRLGHKTARGIIDPEHDAAASAAALSVDTVLPCGALAWESESRALKALRAARAAARAARSNKPPLAEWEQKALAAGWKPPKGRM